MKHEDNHEYTDIAIDDTIQLIDESDEDEQPIDLPISHVMGSLIGGGQSQGVKVPQSNLSKQSEYLIQQFKKQLKQMKFPNVLHTSSISLRSVINFFYDYQPDKGLSLRIQDIHQANELDIFVFSFSVFQDKESDNFKKTKNPYDGITLQQDIVCKQLIQIYQLLNRENLHIYIKNPYNLNSTILSNGYPICRVMYIHPHIIHHLKNSLNVNFVNAFFNIYQMQDILCFGHIQIKYIQQMIQTQQSSASSIYSSVESLNASDKSKYKDFIQPQKESRKFAASRYTIQGYIIVFTELTVKQLKTHIESLQSHESKMLQTYPLAIQQSDIKLNLYVSLYQRFIITNIHIQFNSLQYSQIDGLSYQFDINSIYFLMCLQLILKREIQIDLPPISAHKYVELLDQIQLPARKDMIFKHKSFISPMLTHYQQFKKNRKTK